MVWRRCSFLDKKKNNCFYVNINDFFIVIGHLWKYIDNRKLIKKLVFQGQLLEHLDEGVIASDLSGKIITWNPGAEMLFQYIDKEIIGKPLEILCMKTDSEGVCSLFSMDSKDGYNNSDTEFIRKDNTSFLFIICVRLKMKKV